jgi:hypothetical protein
VFCAQGSQVVSRDYVLQFQRRLRQIPSRLRAKPHPGGRVVVRDTVHFYWKDKPLLVAEIPIVLPKEVSANLSA